VNGIHDMGGMHCMGPIQPEELNLCSAKLGGDSVYVDLWDDHLVPA